MSFRLSKEQLEKIKQSAKKKKFTDILEEEKKKKKKPNDEDSSSDSTSDDTNNDDSDDVNFITDRNGQKTKIKPKAEHLRSLDKEKGGVQIDPEEVQKNIEKHEDLWDLKDAGEMIEEAQTLDNAPDDDAFKAFIHNVKTGGYGGRKRKRSMGQVNLTEMARELKHQEKNLSFVEKLKRRMLVGGGREGGGRGF